MPTTVITDARTGERIEREMTPDEINALPKPPTETEILAAARSKRNSLLAASDWTQVADAPVDQAAWATYRQALRDIPTQAGFPKTIDWPAVP